MFPDPLAAALLPESLRLPAKLFALRPVAAMLTAISTFVRQERALRHSPERV